MRSGARAGFSSWRAKPGRLLGRSVGLRESPAPSSFLRERGARKSPPGGQKLLFFPPPPTPGTRCARAGEGAGGSRPTFGKEAKRLCGSATAPLPSNPSPGVPFLLLLLFLLLRWAGRLRSALPREGGGSSEGGGGGGAPGRCCGETQQGGRRGTLPLAWFRGGEKDERGTKDERRASGRRRRRLQAGAMGERLRGQAGVSSSAAAAAAPPTCSLHNGLPLHNGFHPLAGNGEASHPLHFRADLPLSSHESSAKKSRARLGEGPVRQGGAGRHGETNPGAGGVLASEESPRAAGPVFWGM
uniref:Uncharacterized protein n=1 Tax=Pseudonaja textilis TaxID=8673 RepID=A0A670ZJD4_PSETE